MFLFVHEDAWGTLAHTLFRTYDAARERFNHERDTLLDEHANNHEMFVFPVDAKGNRTGTAIVSFRC